jgi:transposase
MIECKRCQSQKTVKNGKSREVQRYKCKECGYNFVNQDARTSPEIAAKKSLCVLLYGLGKASFNMLGKIFGHSPALIYRWVRKDMESTPDPEVPGDIKEMEFDEMWHFVGQKKTENGSSKPWIVAQGKLLPGWLVIVMLKPLENSMKK